MKISVQPQKHLCELYWQNMRNSGQVKDGIISAVRHHFNLTDVNKVLVGDCRDTSHLRKIYDIPKILRESDADFKCLKPTKRDMTLWRGVSRPLEDVPADGFFKESLYVKKGDTIRLPGYIYAAQEKETAELFSHASTDTAVIYKINVPKGAHISESGYYVFPRNSKFVCTDTRAVDDGTQSYQQITLDYIKPESKTKKLWHKFLNRVVESFTDSRPEPPSAFIDFTKM